jgi:hypothetical protein
VVRVKKFEHQKKAPGGGVYINIQTFFFILSTLLSFFFPPKKMIFTRVLGKSSVNAIRVQKANARSLGRAVTQSVTGMFNYTIFFSD